MSSIFHKFCLGGAPSGRRVGGVQDGVFNVLISKIKSDCKVASNSICGICSIRPSFFEYLTMFAILHNFAFGGALCRWRIRGWLGCQTWGFQHCWIQKRSQFANLCPAGFSMFVALGLNFQFSSSLKPIQHACLCSWEKLADLNKCRQMDLTPPKSKAASMIGDTGKVQAKQRGLII